MTNEQPPIHLTSADVRLGRIAYEAYCDSTEWKSAITGQPLPIFEQSPEPVRRAWIAAAAAVRHVTEPI